MKESLADLDRYSEHFLSQTWQLQGSSWMDNIRENLSQGRIRPETMWTGIPKMKGKKCLVLGAGPSLLERSASLIGLYRNGGCEDPIIATGHALENLRDPKILKHIKAVTVLEATLETVLDMKQWWKGLDTKRLTLVTTPYAEDALFDLWKGPVKFVNVVFSNPELQLWSLRIQMKTGCPALITGSTVGVMSLVLAFNLGAPDIGLLGYDNCLYEDKWPNQTSFQTVDSRGRVCWLPWPYYVSQFELRFLTQDMQERFQVQVTNLSEGGLLRGMPSSTLKTWSEGAIHITPNQSYLVPERRR